VKLEKRSGSAPKFLGPSGSGQTQVDEVSLRGSRQSCRQGQI